MLPEISVISARRPSISSIDRSVAEQPGIFSKPWVLGAKAAQRVCVNISTRSRGHVEFTTLNKLHASAPKKTQRTLFEVFQSQQKRQRRETGMSTPLFKFCKL